MFTTAVTKQYKLNSFTVPSTFVVEGVASPQLVLGNLSNGTYELLVFESDRLTQEFPGKPESARIVRRELLRLLEDEAKQSGPAEEFLVYRRKKIRLICMLRDYLVVSGKDTSLSSSKRIIEELFAHYERQIVAWQKQQADEIPF